MRGGKMEGVMVNAVDGYAQVSCELEENQRFWREVN